MSKVICQLEHVSVPVSIGRTFQDGMCYENRDPYDSAFVVKWHADNNAEVCAVDKLLTKEEQRAIRKVLLAHGVTIFTKDKNGKLIQRRVR